MIGPNLSGATLPHPSCLKMGYSDWRWNSHVSATESTNIKKKDEYTKYGEQKEIAWIEIADELLPEFMLCEKTHTC